MDGWLLDAAQWSAVRLSVQVALVATLATLPLGIVLGYLLARRQFWGRSAVETLLSLPLVLPPVVTGYLLLVTFGRRGWLGHALESWFGLSIAFTWKGAALASAVMAFPLMLRAIQIAMAQVDVGLEQAARTLGASRLETFWRVTLPLARRGVVAGALLAFTRGLGEFGATIMIAANIPGETQTMPLYIYSALGTPDGLKSSSGLVIASVLIAGGALWLAQRLERTGRNNSKRHGTQRNAPQAVRAGGELGSGQ